ncbi:hypothetical protein [Marinobacter sp. CHS3-4]|uniref:hypothetical protein n=1 Tax=Marinobacter sp. CHS3-4 TaxID=3045174 RepID=UPI0024B55AB3|nr:hypothetical protein [Marinobacter sp. CHS3-4]MDI9246374.1 hypothetical protein [Marinobacter sp. CHS3-4]
MTEEMLIPITYEEMSEELKNEIPKLTQIVQPVISVENDISIILSSIKQSGNVIFFLGKSGIGKSTFIDSLKWRSHIVKRSVINIDSSDLVPEKGLNGLFLEIKKISESASREADNGPTIIVIDYLESIEDQPETQIKSFFRNLNGLVRKSPILIIWPVTLEEDARLMIDVANKIATTLFYEGKEILYFDGPEENKFIDIAKRTITTINNGKEPSEFGLTNDVFTEVFSKFEKLSQAQRSIRRFLQLIKSNWELQSGHLEKIKHKIPKPIEVWLCFPYKSAESVISQFSRKGQSVEETWTPIHDKFYEYIPDSQRSAVWNATRLQFALYGYIKTRIMFLPTNALISSVYAYSNNSAVTNIISKHTPPTHWQKKTNSRKFLSSSPIVKQALGEKYQVGMRKGGPAARALEIAEPIYKDLNLHITSSGGSDKNLNKPLAAAIADVIGFNVHTETRHPWLSNVYPDIWIDFPDKTVSIEMHYTDDDSPYKIADYVLKKLNTYMAQIEEITNS